MHDPDPKPISTASTEDARLLRLATSASMLVATLLIVAKAFAFFATGAVSLLASLVDSLIDAAASLLNFLAVRYALAPADREHRFGHGKAESLAALLQSVLILGSSFYLV
jgi:ferrous-iron efflux pump FieF